LPCGVEAAALNPFRCASKAVFRPASACGALAAIVVRHASYFWIYSSHSATPVTSLAVAVFEVSVFALVFAVVFAGAVVVVEDVLVTVVFAALLAVELDVLVAAPPQPNERRAKHSAAAIMIKLLIFINFRFLSMYIYPPTQWAADEDKEHLQFSCWIWCIFERQTRLQNSDYHI
jgi:hypothetical protein